MSFARFILVFVALGCAFAQKQVPRFKAIFEPVNVKADVKLLDVHFVSDQAGWLAGGKDELSGGVILYTEDGGKNWTTQLGDLESSDRIVRLLRFADDHTGWAIQGASGGGARLLHTSDGHNWNQVGMLPEHVADYTFTSEKHGLSVEGDRISLTQDGGQHWKTVATCNLEAQVNGLTQRVHCGYTSIHFPTPLVGYAVAKGGPNGMFILFKTTDGGATWQGATHEGDRDAEDVFFINANTGYVRTGYPDTGRLFRTADGGQTFTGMAASPGARIKFADPSVGWAFHYGKLSYTTTGGDRWTSRSFNFPATLYAFSLPSRRRAYVVGLHGMVYRYSIVPAEYSAPGMLDAPLMPSSDQSVK